MLNNFGGSLKKNNNILGIFFVFHCLIWSLLPMLRNLLPVDALEVIYWGNLTDFGTNKHPPIAGWIGAFFHNLLPYDFTIYLLGQICVIVGFYFLYKLAKIFLTEKQSIVSILLMEGCLTYSYMSGFDGFNPNFLMFVFLPAITYYLYKCIDENKLYYWVILGICTGLAFLSKYQFVLLFLSLLIYLLIFKRRVFKEKGIYIAFVLSLVIFLPHLMWLFNHDFFSFLYFSNCEENYLTAYQGWTKYIQAPFMFLLLNFVMVLGTLIMFGILYLYASKNNLKIEKSLEKEKIAYLIFAGILPFILQVLPACFTGAKIVATWGYPLLYMTGILLFVFIPIEIKEKEISFCVKMVSIVALIIFTIYSSIYIVEKNFHSRLEYAVISKDLKSIYYQKTKRPLEYLCGYIEYTLPVSIYDKTHPKTILNTYGKENPWINIRDVKKNGIMILSKDEESINEYKKNILYFLPKDYKSEIYSHEIIIHNWLKQTRKRFLYYSIIYPE